MRPDADLQKRVFDALVAAPDVDETVVGVSTHHGVVTLVGTTGSYAEKHAIESVVHGVAGVLDVANDITVSPPWRTGPNDTEIAEAVRNALAASPVVPHERIRSTVYGRGHVVLEGAVSLCCEREDAEAAVRDLDGVELVTNLIAVDNTSVDRPPDTRRRA